MSLVVRAALFAAREHRRTGQRRKYTLAPYIVHPEAVAALVCSVPHTEEQHAASWLHDVVEDCGVPLTLIREEFGEEVARLVGDLTDVSRPEDGRRMIRRAIDRAHTAHTCPEAKTIKLADIIDNAGSILELDPGFAQIYLREKQLVLPYLMDGDPTLWERAYRICFRQPGYHTGEDSWNAL